MPSITTWVILAWVLVLSPLAMALIAIYCCQDKEQHHHHHNNSQIVASSKSNDGTTQVSMYLPFIRIYRNSGTRNNTATIEEIKEPDLPSAAAKPVIIPDTKEIKPVPITKPKVVVPAQPKPVPTPVTPMLTVKSARYHWKIDNFEHPVDGQIIYINSPGVTRSILATPKGNDSYNLTVSTDVSAVIISQKRPPVTYKLSPKTLDQTFGDVKPSSAYQYSSEFIALGDNGEQFKLVLKSTIDLVSNNSRIVPVSDTTTAY